MGNHDHGFTAARHLPKRIKHILGFLRCQNRRRLIQDQDLAALMQQFDDLHTLLFTDRKLPHQCLRRDLQIVLLGTGPDLGFHFIVMKKKALLPGIQKDILRHRQRRDQTKVLVHHPDSERHCILWRTNVSFFSLI